MDMTAYITCLKMRVVAQSSFLQILMLCIDATVNVRYDVDGLL